MNKLRLFHVSTSESPISHFHPLAHFGSLVSAVRYASSNAVKDLPKTLYEVEVTYPWDFVLAPDLSGALLGDVHMAGQIAQILGSGIWRSSKLQKAFFDGVVARAANYGPNPAAADLVAGLKAQGFTALTYANRHDGQQSDDWILLEPVNLRIIHVARWSDPETLGRASEPVALFEHWQVALNAIVNARLFLIGLRRAVLPYANQALNEHFWDVISGLDESQIGLTGGQYVSGALMRTRMEEAAAIVREWAEDVATPHGREALEIAGDLALALQHSIENPDALTAEPSVRLRTRFVPLPLSATSAARMVEPVLAH
jgi:hypothetical protein